MTRIYCLLLFFFFKQKTAYEMRISDLSSDVCSSDLRRRAPARGDALYRADLRSAFLDRPRQNLLSIEPLHREPDRLSRGQRPPRNLARRTGAATNRRARRRTGRSSVAAQPRLARPKPTPPRHHTRARTARAGLQPPIEPPP